MRPPASAREPTTDPPTWRPGRHMSSTSMPQRGNQRPPPTGARQEAPRRTSLRKKRPTCSGPNRCPQRTTRRGRIRPRRLADDDAEDGESDEDAAGFGDSGQCDRGWIPARDLHHIACSTPASSVLRAKAQWPWGSSAFCPLNSEAR